MNAAGDDYELPPDVPPEYAEAYRRGYERATRGVEPTARLDESDRPDQQADADRPDQQASADRVGAGRADQPGGADRTDQPGRHERHERHGRQEREERQEPNGSRETGFLDDQLAPVTPPVLERDAQQDSDRRRALLAAAVLSGIALLLVAAAFGLGRLVAGGSEGSADTGPAETAEIPVSRDEREKQGKKEKQAEKPAYEGPVTVVGVGAASASCQSPPSVDEAGNPTRYPPRHAHDQDLTTAWRCDGDGSGEKLTLSLPKGTVVAEVGLVPGYAKTDPASGVDRYAENNRITKVRWVFGDGSAYVQEMSSAPGDRSMRTMRVPETETRKVVVEILDSVPGQRNTIAISEVRIAAPVA
ncbi:MAG: NADase-type glycan-binding domain-containing protein [Nocardioidaceae bacterium]